MAKCPVDGAEMEEKTIDIIDTVVLDSCPKCDGIWMDKGELQRVTKDELIEYRLDRKDQGFRLCPRCQKRMERSQLHGVIVDDCACGIYFDKGEVDKVMGKRLALKSTDGGLSISVTVPQLHELIAKKSIKIDNLEIRLIREKDDQAE